MNRVAVLVLTLTLAMAPIGAMAQPTELFDCMGPGGDRTWCSDVSVADLLDLSCPAGPRVFEMFRGRVAWPPLKYVGPITIEVNALESAGTRFPLLVEFISVKDHPENTGYCDGPAQVLYRVHGSRTCDGWESLGPIQFDPWWLSVGDSYVIRVHFFTDVGSDFTSPWLGCIRVTPDTTTAISSKPWGSIKALYRD